MKSTTILSILVALLVVGGAWFWFSGRAVAPTSPSTGTTVNTNPNGADYTPPADGNGVSRGLDVDVSVQMQATINYTAAGFTPAQVTIKKGGTVTWVSDSATNMWVASANHPTHTVYDGTNLQEHCAAPTADTFDQCKAGKTFSFTFDKVGTWNFHNHLNAAKYGSVTVVE